MIFHDNMSVRSHQEMWNKRVKKGKRNLSTQKRPVKLYCNSKILVLCCLIVNETMTFLDHRLWCPFNGSVPIIYKECSRLQPILPDVWPETVGGKKTVLLATSTRAGGAAGVSGGKEELVDSLVADSSGLAACADSADNVASAGAADTSRAKSWRIWTLMNWGQEGFGFRKT